MSTPETSALVARRGFISRGILGLLRIAHLSGETVRQPVGEDSVAFLPELQETGSASGTSDSSPIQDFYSLT